MEKVDFVNLQETENYAEKEVEDVPYLDNFIFPNIHKSLLLSKQ